MPPSQTVIHAGRMTWSQAVAGPLAGATCLWQDLDGLHRDVAPVEAPPTSTVWGWIGSGRMVRLRLDGDTAYVATCEAAASGQTAKPWSSNDHRVEAIRPEEAVAYLEPMLQVVVDDVGEGAGPITFIRPAGAV
jgi:hypothetical protein